MTSMLLIDKYPALAGCAAGAAADMMKPVDVGQAVRRLPSSLRPDLPDRGGAADPDDGEAGVRSGGSEAAEERGGTAAASRAPVQLSLLQSRGVMFFSFA
jgi:hypothetical protein